MLTDYSHRTRLLEDTVGKLSHENIKIKTEMVILRDEHTEVLHNMFSLHKRNAELENENADLQGGHLTWGNQGSQGNLVGISNGTEAAEAPHFRRSTSAGKHSESDMKRDRKQTQATDEGIEIYGGFRPGQEHHLISFKDKEEERCTPGRDHSVSEHSGVDMN